MKKVYMLSGVARFAAAAVNTPRLQAARVSMIPSTTATSSSSSSSAARPPVTRLMVSSFARHFSAAAATPVNVHVDPSLTNTSTGSFEFNSSTMPRVQRILDSYPSNYKSSAVIPLLDVAQQQNDGFLSLAAMDKVALILGMEKIRVYEVATFYSMFNRAPVGKYHVMVCGTTPCMLRGSRDLEKALVKELGLNGKFETTQDGSVTLGEMECMGCCVNAPMVAVADYTNGVEGYTYNYYEDLDSDSVVKLVRDLRSGVKRKAGSVIRDKAEPFGGETTLLETPGGPQCRELKPLPPPEQK